VKVRTSLITAAAVALVASASAQAAVVREPTLIRGTDKTRTIQGTARESGASGHGRPPEARGSSGGRGATRVIYIDIPVSAPPAPFVDPSACQDSGNGCSDLEACEYWGENCGSLTAADLSADPQQGPAASSSSSSGSSDGASGQ
jgi:hypothetical protein